MEDLIDIDGPKDDVEDDGLLNKLLNESFYLILLLSVYDYLDSIDFFIFIRFEGVGKGAIAVITVMFVTAGTLLIVIAETIVMPGKGAMAVIVVISITVETPLVTIVEIVAIPKTRSD